MKPELKHAHFDISQFDYDLPEAQIPDKPLSERDASKLLIYKQGEISESVFSSLPDLLPVDTLLVMNNSRVFPARLHFKTTAGNKIEIFCLAQKSAIVRNNIAQSVQWECMIGHAKKWKASETLQCEYPTQSGNSILEVKRLEALNGTFIIEFSWHTHEHIFEILESIGELPLPPYMNRKAGDDDKLRYQTVYAGPKGSVAAPTAGLHFTNEVIEALNQKGIERAEVTLHVGAGTFRPIKTDNIKEHEMHAEQFHVSIELLNRLKNAPRVIPVGTTSMRVLESLYILGRKLVQTGVYTGLVEQWDGFEETDNITVSDAMQALISYAFENELESLAASTQIFIIPGFEFKICKGMITNFHQPKSTLIVLIASLLGEKWREMYQYALSHHFRFLSYGDSSLLLP